MKRQKTSLTPGPGPGAAAAAPIPSSDSEGSHHWPQEDIENPVQSTEDHLGSRAHAADPTGSIETTGGLGTRQMVKSPFPNPTQVPLLPLSSNIEVPGNQDGAGTSLVQYEAQDQHRDFSGDKRSTLAYTGTEPRVPLSTHRNQTVPTSGETQPEGARLMVKSPPLIPQVPRESLRQSLGVASNTIGAKPSGSKDKGPEITNRSLPSRPGADADADADSDADANPWVRDWEPMERTGVKAAPRAQRTRSLGEPATRRKFMEPVTSQPQELRRSATEDTAHTDQRTGWPPAPPGRPPPSNERL